VPNDTDKDVCETCDLRTMSICTSLYDMEIQWLKQIKRKLED
jgi:hypothetical protein